MTSPLDRNTRMSATRTRLAHERTLMAWIRTCASLIAFGFTIYQIFRYIAATDRLTDPVVSPMWVGVAMMLVGLGVLVAAWLQHRRDLENLHAEFGEMPTSLAAIAAGLIAGLGIIALVGVIRGSSRCSPIPGTPVCPRHRGPQPFARTRAPPRAM